MADTDVTLSVGLNVADAEKTAEQLHKEVQKIFESNNGQSSASLTRVELQLKKTSKEASALSEHLDALKSTTVFGEDIHNLEDARVLLGKVKVTYQELMDAREKLDDMRIQALANGGSLEIDGELKTAQELETTIDKTEDAIIEMLEAMQVLQDRIATEQALDEMNDKLKQEIIHYQEIIALEEKRASKDQERADKEQEKADRKERADIRTDQLDAHRGTSTITKTIKEVKELIPGLSKEVENSINSTVEGIQTVSSLMGGELVGSISDVKVAVTKLFAYITAHPVVALITAILALIVTIAKEVKKLYDQTAEEVDALLDLLKAGSKNLLKISKDVIGTLANGFIKLGLTAPKLFARGISEVINKLMSLKGVIMENLTLMAKWNKGNNAVNRALSNLISSLNYLKATLATAIAPLLIAIEPIITQIINALGQALTYLGMFFAKVTGATYFQKAIRIQKDYAKSLKETQNQLAGFDKLNVLTTRKSDDVGFGMTSPEKIGDLFKDWRDLGKKIGEWLKDALDSVPWDKIKKKAKEVANAIAEIVNGFISVKDLSKSIGQTMGEALNTISIFVNEFFDTLQGQKLGKFLGDIFENMITTVDWYAIGRMFSNALNTLADVIYGFTNWFDGSTLGDAITEFLEGSLGEIDWTTIERAAEGLMTDLAEMLNGVITPENFELIASTLSHTLTTIFDSAYTFANNVDWEQWGTSIGTAINTFIEETDWTLGADAINTWAHGLLDSLIAAIDEINWTSEDGSPNIADTIINFLASIDWAGIADKAVEIARELRKGLESVWQELKDSGALDDLIGMIVDFLNEKKTWEDMFDRVRKDIIRQVIKEKFKSFIESIATWFLDTLAESINLGMWDLIPGMKSARSGKNAHDVINWGGLLGAGGAASGAVIPPTASPHPVIVGDNKHETEIISPLSTMEQALRNVLAEQTVNVTFEVQGDPEHIFNVVRKQSNQFTGRTGLNWA